eukprot:6948302-Karenia_brevis.AAC.1
MAANQGMMFDQGMADASAHALKSVLSVQAIQKWQKGEDILDEEGKTVGMKREFFAYRMTKDGL